MKELRYNLSCRLFTDVKCFGPGVAQLLHRVNALGFKLLASTTGGKHGGGAALTPEGQALLSAYDQFCAELREYGDKLFAEKFGEFLN